MKVTMSFYSIWIPCLLVADAMASSVLSGSIDPSVRKGPYTKIAENVTIKANTVIGNYATIESDTVIEENSIIGDYVHIFKRCLLGAHTVFGNYAKIGEKTTIAQKVQIQTFSTVGNNNQIKMGSALMQYSNTGPNVKIDEMVIMDQYARFNGENIGKRAYLGQHCVIGENVNIGESAIIHLYVVLKSDTKIKPTEIVIRTPTSLLFYQQGARDITSDEANIAKPSGQGISPAFNKYLRELIEKDMQTLRTSCSQSINRPQNLKKIISMYLIHYHGLERFNEYIGGIQGGKNLPNAVREMLRKECHLGENAANNKLEPDVREKFIQLLTLDQDVSRQYRVEGDKFCDMLDQIQKKRRNIRFDGAECNSSNN